MLRPSSGTPCSLCSLPMRCSRSEEHTSELQSRGHLVCRLLLEKKKSVRHRAIRRAFTYPGALLSTTSTTSSIPSLSLHDALPIYLDSQRSGEPIERVTVLPVSTEGITTSVGAHAASQQRHSLLTLLPTDALLEIGRAHV